MTKFEQALMLPSSTLRDFHAAAEPLRDEAVAVLARSTTLSDLRVLDLSFSDQMLTSRGLESLAT